MAGVQLTKNKWVLVLVAVLLLQSAGIAILAAKYHSLSQNDRNSDTVSSAHNRLSPQLLSNDIQSVFAAEKVVFNPEDSMVYIPEFKIKLPFDDISKSLAYTMRGYLPAYIPSNASWNHNNTVPEADFTSTYYAHLNKTTTMDCGILARIKLEAEPKPYSPHEKPISVKLADGRTLQVYQTINQKECQQSWTSSIAPPAVAGTLIKAQSY